MISTSFGRSSNELQPTSHVLPQVHAVEIEHVTTRSHLEQHTSELADLAIVLRPVLVGPTGLLRSVRAGVLVFAVRTRSVATDVECARFSAIALKFDLDSN